jgi:hypothetical protein
MYGILKSITNTGSDAELTAVFSTPLSVNSHQPAYSQDTLSLKRRTSVTSAHRWEIEAEIAPTNDSAAMMVHSIKANQGATVYIRMPQVFYPNGNTSKNTPVGTKLTTLPTLTTSTSYALGATVISLNGLTTHDVAEGEFIQFVGDPKVYLVTGAPAGNHGANLTIFPSLRKAVTGGVVCNYGSKVTMYAKYDKDSFFGIKYSDGVLSSPGSYKFVEALGDY